MNDLSELRRLRFYEALFFCAKIWALLALIALLAFCHGCAAPGGKSFAAAIDAHNRGALLSCDIHEKKLKRIEDGADRLGISILKTRAMDARSYDPALESAFDAVLADVPCSGFGVIRKRPEIRWKEEEEIARLPEIQADILQNLSRYVRPGGVLLYSTCTILKEENEEIVSSFLRHNEDFFPEDFTIGAISSVSGCYTFWPQSDGTDGFFAAKLRRKAE